MCNPDFKTKANGVAAAKSSSSKTISPTIASGFSRRKVSITTAMLGLVTLYNFLLWLLKDSSAWLRPADEFCPEDALDANGKCSRPDLFAAQFASGMMQLYMGGTGLMAWHISKCVTKNLPQTPEGRLFGYLEEADKLLVGIFVYQTYDFFKSLMVPEHNSIIFLFHHAVAAFTAFMALEYQMVHYYAVFFGGCSEISTIFLVLCDFDTYFPVQDRGSTWGMVITLCQACFFFCFLYYRIIAWWQVSFTLWSDVLTVAKKGTINDYRPGTGWFLYWFLVSDILLGSLQLYWFFFGILPKLFELLG